MFKKRDDEPQDLTTLPEETLRFLEMEYDALRSLYNDAASRVQSIFNFYLTLVSTIFGAVVLIVQFSPGGVQQVIISGLLLFASTFGIVYLSALVGQYAHMARYARGIDQMRRYLIDQQDLAVPEWYYPVRSAESDSPQWFEVLFPTGSYQFFVAVVNGFSLALAVWLLLSAGGFTGARFARSVIGSGVIFVVTLTIQNAYAQIVMRRMVERLGIRIDISGDFGMFAGRQ